MFVCEQYVGWIICDKENTLLPALVTPKYNIIHWLFPIFFVAFMYGTNKEGKIKKKSRGCYTSLYIGVVFLLWVGVYIFSMNCLCTEGLLEDNVSWIKHHFMAMAWFVCVCVCVCCFTKGSKWFAKNIRLYWFMVLAGVDWNWIDFFFSFTLFCLYLLFVV